MRKLSEIFLALILILVTVTGCSGDNNGGSAGATDSGSTIESAAAGAHEQNMSIVMSADITSMDPTTSASLWSQYVLFQTYDRLYEFDEDMAPVPHLAKTTEMVSDTEWLITLQEDVKFSDGSPLTAKDVKASLDRAIASGIAGSLMRPLESVDVVDDLTIRITTTSLYPQLTLAISHVSTCILPADYLLQVEETKDWSSPVCSGRYTFASRIPGENIVLTPNEHFWDNTTAAKNTSLTFHVVPESSTRTIMVQTGEADLNVDFSTTDYELAASDSKVSIYEHASCVMTFMTLDCQNEYLSSKTIRQALNYAIDRENVLLVQENGYGAVNYTYMSNPCFGWMDNPGSYSYDPDKARALLVEAGYADGFNMDLYVTADYTSAASLIQANLQEVGITANIQMMESLDEIVARAVDGSLTSCVTIWGCYTDPTLVVERNLGESALGAYNISRYVNEELEGLWQYGYAYQDVAERIPYYEQWQEILTDDSPWVPLYVGKIFVVANAELQGVELSTEQAFNFYNLTY